MKDKWLVLTKRLASHELILALIVAVIIIAVGAGVGWENNKAVPVNPATSAHYTKEPGNRLSFLSNWDGPLYLGISRHGYTNKSDTGFFPLYPLAVRIVNTVIPSTLYSGLLVAWVSFVGAIFFFLKIIKKIYGLKDNLEALRGVAFFALFPTGVFLIATYTESLYAFLALGSIYYTLRKRYIVASLFALLCTATHPTGVFIVALIGMIMLEQKAKIARVLRTLVVGSLGLVGYMIYLQYRFHNSLAFVASQKHQSWLNFSFIHLLNEIATRNGFFLILVLVSVVYWWTRKKSFSIYSMFYVSIVLLGGEKFSGFGRYALMAFPVELMLYDYFRDKKIAYQLVFGLSCILWAYFMLQYAGGYSGG